MSKAKSNRKGKAAEAPADKSKRKFLALGLGGAGMAAVAGIGYKAGWFGSSSTSSALPAVSPTPKLATGKPLPPVTLAPNLQNAITAANEFTSYFARELNNASTLIHCIRAFGKNFKLNDGSSALEFLCTRFAADKEVNGKRYVYFVRDAEVHENSFLKTFLEAGVSPDYPITAGPNKYTLHDLGESAKALFRCDTNDFNRYEQNLIGQHLPWGLIAFSILVPPSQPTWVNAYGETINLPEVIDRSLAVFESTCAEIPEAAARPEGESMEFRKAISKFSCAGMHTVYSYYSLLNHGYRNNDMEARLAKLLDNTLLRMKTDSQAIDREADAAVGAGPELIARMAFEDQGGRIATKGTAPSNVLEVMRYRYQIRMLGHAMESINYIQLHKLYTLTAAQKGRLQAGEQLLYDNLVKLRATNMQPFMNWYPKFVSDTVISTAHAARGLKLLTSDNPDTVA